MSELEKRVIELETEKEELKLEIQALRIAVVTMSAVVNDGIGKSAGLMGNTVDESMIFDEDIHENEEWFNKLKSKVVYLLGKESSYSYFDVLNKIVASSDWRLNYLFLLPFILDLAYSSQLVIRFFDSGQQRLDPENSLAIRQRAGGNGGTTGCVNVPGIGVHCAGT